MKIVEFFAGYFESCYMICGFMYSTNFNILRIFEDTCYIWNNAEHLFDVCYANFELSR